MKLLGHDIDLDVVSRGAFVATVIVIPMAFVLGRVIDDESNWQIPFTLAVFTAFVAGGAVAGRLAPRTPAIHGALTALPCLALVTLAAILRSVFGDGNTTVVRIVSPIIIAISLAMLGGAAGSRFGDHSRSLVD